MKGIVKQVKLIYVKLEEQVKLTEQWRLVVILYERAKNERPNNNSRSENGKYAIRICHFEKKCGENKTPVY